jgi:hypothetical protein
MTKPSINWGQVLEMINEKLAQKAMTTTLLPCPFCGGTAIYFKDHTTEKCDSIYCEKCDCRVSDFNIAGPTGSCRELWNTRAPTTESKP